MPLGERVQEGQGILMHGDFNRCRNVTVLAHRRLRGLLLSFQLALVVDFQKLQRRAAMILFKGVTKVANLLETGVQRSLFRSLPFDQESSRFPESYFQQPRFGWLALALCKMPLQLAQGTIALRRQGLDLVIGCSRQPHPILNLP